MLKIKAVGINARYVHSCLSLFYLRNELEANIDDVSVEICHYTINDPFYILIQRLSEGNPDYIFFSSAIWNSDLITDLLTDLLVITETCGFVIGGPQAEIVGRKFADTSRVTIYRGAIEGADKDFYAALVQKKLGQGYQSEFFKIRTPWFSFPYRTEDFEGPLLNRHVYYESSRGCPFSCSYCLSSTEKGLYHKPLDHVFSELDVILSFKPSVVRFIDRTFNDIPERALAIWEFLLTHDKATLFHFEIAPDRFTNEMFELLKRVRPNRFQFEIGVQSTNGKTLEAIKRVVDPAKASENIRKIRNLETIHLHADLILGLPFETEESFKRSVNDIFQMTPHYIQMGLLKLLPGTLIERQAVEYGYRVSKRAPYSIYANRWIECERFSRLYWLGECVEKFVNNRYFITVWSYLAAREDDIASFFASLSQTFLRLGYFWKAATQERLSSILCEYIATRADSKLLIELLRYDWLRCGHRFLPAHLGGDRQGIDEIRRKLFKLLPEELEPSYDRQSRGYFFKKSVFYYFSGEALEHIGYEGSCTEPGILRFSSEREENVLRLHKVEFIETGDGDLLKVLTEQVLK